MGHTRKSHAAARRRIAGVVAPLLGASLLLASAGSVAATEPATYVLDVFYCTLSDENGEVLAANVVPAGSEIILFEGWIALTRGQVQSFANTVTWILTVDGESVDVTPYLTGPIPFGPFWGDVFSISAGTLDSGDSLRTHYDNVLRAASFDGFVHYPIGSVYGGGVDCTVTASGG